MKGLGSESFRLVNKGRFEGSGEGMETTLPFLIPYPMHLSNLALPELYPYIINL